jgi:uncharacterized coiled-coil protein SlyX
MIEFTHLKNNEDPRSPGFGEIYTITERSLMDKILNIPLLEAKAKRIAELEAQVADYKEDLIEALQDVINYAPACTSSIEYAEKRLKELTEVEK